MDPVSNDDSAVRNEFVKIETELIGNLIEIREEHKKERKDMNELRQTVDALKKEFPCNETIGEKNGIKGCLSKHKISAITCGIVSIVIIALVVIVILIFLMIALKHKTLSVAFNDMFHYFKNLC